MTKAFHVTVDELAQVYAIDSHCALAIARLCDDYVDRSGALLGYVRDRASELKKAPTDG